MKTNNYKISKVIPRIFGGLGNQLFCYAAARRLSLVNDAELVLDDVSGFLRDFAYRRTFQLNNFNIPCRNATAAERFEPFARTRRFCMRTINNYLPFESRNYIFQSGNDFEPRLLQLQSKGTVYLEGFWQSENYFKDVESIIRKDLQIKPPADQANLDMCKRILNCTAVAVHFRFFDQPATNSFNNAPLDYYVRAIELIRSKIPDAHFFVFSDQPDSAHARIPQLVGRATFISHNKSDEDAYVDMWLMKQCQHFVIANSTFSWWGAWLSEHPDKLVIAPRLIVYGSEYVSSWGFKGLLPEEWLVL